MALRGEPRVIDSIIIKCLGAFLNQFREKFLSSHLRWHTGLNDADSITELKHSIKNSQENYKKIILSQH